MYHINKFSRIASNISTSLLILYFVFSKVGLGHHLVMLYIPAIWALIYGLLLIRATSTDTYYRFFIITNLIGLLVGLALSFFFKSAGGNTVFTVAITMLTMVFSLSRKIQNPA